MIYRNLPFNDLPQLALFASECLPDQMVGEQQKKSECSYIYIERERAIVYDGWKTDSRYPISSTGFSCQ